MLLKALIVFVACSLMCQAELLKRYKSQTIIEVALKPAESFPLCKCESDKCELNQSAAEEVCKVLMERFRFYAYPNPYLMLCEVPAKTCTAAKGGKPTAYYVQGIFDSFYLRTSPINFDKASPAQALVQIIRKNVTYPHVVFDQEPIKATVTTGFTAMPIEFEGELNLQVSDIKNFDVCYDSSCRKTINDLCDGFTESMKAVVPQIMPQFLGCHVRYIYKKNNQVFASWAMMFHHRRLVTAKVSKSTEELIKLTEHIKTSVKPPSIVKSFRVTGVIPLDFCEIGATSDTNLKYHPYMADPTSFPYKINSRLLYTELTRQILIGGGQQPTCLRRVIEMHLSNNNSLVKAKARLWVSLGCYRKRGIKTCQGVTKEIANVWKNGSALAYNFFAPEYKFDLLHINAAYDE